jgi:hypothetical protein
MQNIPFGGKIPADYFDESRMYFSMAFRAAGDCIVSGILAAFRARNNAMYVEQ